MNNLKKFIENYISLPTNEWEQISKCFEKRIIRKDEIILAEGTVCRHLYFVENGLLRFYINKDGNDITKFFTESPIFSPHKQVLTPKSPLPKIYKPLNNQSFGR